MNSKERVLNTINHIEPDKVPIGEWDFGKELAWPALGRESYYPLTLKQTKAYWEGKRDQVINDWKTGLVKLVQKLNWDAVLVHLNIGKDTPIEVPEQIKENKWRDKHGNILLYSEDLDRICLMEKGEPGSIPVPPATSVKKTNEPDDSELELVRHVVKELGKTHFIFSAPLWRHPKLAYEDIASGGQVEAWVKLYEDPEAFLERRMKALKAPECKRGMEIAKREGVDAIAGGCDYGTNSGPFMSPDMFKKYIQPALAEHVRIVHSFGMPYLHHSCGNNQELMDMIVEAGVDVYQSIQAEMDIIKMKKRYGKNITFWGGTLAGDLVTSTPEHIEAESRKYLEECKSGGGYIFGTSHSIMPGSKYENYLAMLDAHKKYGNY